VTQSFLWDFCQPFLRFCPGDIVTQSFFKVRQTFLRFYQPFFWFRSLIHRVCSVTCVFELFLRFCEPFFCDFGTDSVTRWVHVQYGLVDFFSVRHPRRLGTASVQNNRNEFPPSSGHVLWGQSIHIFFHELFAFLKGVGGNSWAPWARGSLAAHAGRAHGGLTREAHGMGLVRGCAGRGTDAGARLV
jgi:hypothetical protein